jgi:acetyltransferase EpsM
MNSSNSGCHDGRAVILVGGGEHACVVADAAVAAGMRLRGYVDAKEAARVERAFGLARLGAGVTVVREHTDAVFVMAIGGKPARIRVADEFERQGAVFAAVVHPRAVVAASADVGHGVVIFAGAVVNHGACLGAHAIVNTSAVVEHDVVLGPSAHVCPGVVIGGGARIGARTVLGLGSRVRDHISIGADVFVGMGAVVVHDVPHGQTVMGIPARARPQR